MLREARCNVSAGGLYDPAVHATDIDLQAVSVGHSGGVDDVEAVNRLASYLSKPLFYSLPGKEASANSIARSIVMFDDVFSFSIAWRERGVPISASMSGG